MPKIIDHEQRSGQIATAAMHLLTEGGIAKLSVRQVADRANLAVASLRNSFPTQASLRIYCLDLIVKRVQERLNSISLDQTALGFAQDCLEQLLPLDEERRIEMESFLTLGTMGNSDPALLDAYRQANDQTGLACQTLTAALTDDPEKIALIASQLHALVDGLSLHLLRQPETSGTQWATEALSSFLKQIASEKAELAATTFFGKGK